MAKIKFYECLECGRRVDEATARLENWDFGVDMDAAEPDKDNGVRGKCNECIRKEADEWTQENEAEFRRLNAKRMKAYRDRKRARKYSPRPSRLFVK
jgi:hypothetical protein